MTCWPAPGRSGCPGAIVLRPLPRPHLGRDRAVLGDSLDVGLGLLGVHGNDDVVDPALRPEVAEVLGH